MVWSRGVFDKLMRDSTQFDMMRSRATSKKESHEIASLNLGKKAEQSFYFWYYQPSTL